MRFPWKKVNVNKKKPFEEVIETAANNLMQKINRIKSSEILETDCSDAENLPLQKENFLEVGNETQNKDKKISKAVTKALTRLGLLPNGSKKEHKPLSPDLSAQM